MTLVQERPRRLRSTSTRDLGRLTLEAGVLGAVSAAVVVVWPDQVAESRYSYPFTPTGYAVAQVFFAAQHLALLAGLVALVRVTRGSSRTTRVGAWIAVVGMLGLTGCELFALTAADAATTSEAADAVNASYGGPTVVLGLGLVLAGAGLLRRPVLTGADRWVVLVLGAWIFVVLLPALFGPLVAGRLAIGTWMLLFAWLGAALVRHAEARS